MNLLNWLLPDRSLAQALDPRKKVKIHGIKFTLRKLNPMDHLTGAQVLRRVHEIYQKNDASGEVVTEGMVEKLKKHYTDVFMASVVSVRCLGKELEPTRKEAGPGKLPVGHLLTDWELAEQLYTAIMEFTYGKKKLKQLR
jgi:hypothetical protein